MAAPWTVTYLGSIGLPLVIRLAAGPSKLLAP
jgi:hypothetical protein